MAASISAARSARAAASSARSLTTVSTAVFSPLKLKSRLPLAIMGRGKVKRPAFPVAASRASAGPPG